MRTEAPLTEETEQETAGQQFIRRIGPAGCFLFLALAVLVTMVCLRAGTDPVPGYESPYDTAYWIEHPDALAEELNQNLLPRLDGSSMAEVVDNHVIVTIDDSDFAVTRSAVLRYFDRTILDFERGALP